MEIVNNFVCSPGIAGSSLCHRIRKEGNFNVEHNNNWLTDIFCYPRNADLFSNGNYFNYIHVNSGHIINGSPPGYGKCFS